MIETRNQLISHLLKTDIGGNRNVKVVTSKAHFLWKRVTLVDRLHIILYRLVICIRKQNAYFESAPVGMPQYNDN